MPDRLAAWLSSLPDVAKSEAEVRLRRLARFVYERRLRFLFGAGMSFKSGMPLAAKLSDKLLGEMFLLNGSPDPKLVSAYPVDAIAEAYLTKFDEASLFDIINTTYSVSGNLHEGHFALQLLADQGYLGRVYTTNFDTLLEEAFSTRGATITDSTIDALIRLEEDNRVPILHLHGAVHSAPKIIE